ncbi:hypothetical protein JTB14_017243 [Gonioctena quinquepunctata]|nr:hypothetical protein JTB14_017243 [Gonioctena quinquepunctata]
MRTPDEQMDESAGGGMFFGRDYIPFKNVVTTEERAGYFRGSGAHIKPTRNNILHKEATQSDVAPRIRSVRDRNRRNGPDTLGVRGRKSNQPETISRTKRRPR